MTREPLSAVQELDALRKFRLAIESARDRLNEELQLPPEAVSIAPTPPSVEVLVRNTPGPEPKIFHSADDPCGRVTGEGRSPDNFNRMPRSRAEARGLQPCTSCTWRQVRKADQSA